MVVFKIKFFMASLLSLHHGQVYSLQFSALGEWVPYNIRLTGLLNVNPSIKFPIRNQETAPNQWRGLTVS